MFYFSYLFTVLVLVFLVFFLMLMYSTGMIYLKFLIMLIYVSGVVVFMLYISCMCWNKSHSFNVFFLIFVIFILNLWDLGLEVKFSDVGEFLWSFFIFSYLFNVLVSKYSLNLYKNSGSLRF